MNRRRNILSTLIDDLVNVYKPGNCTYRRVEDTRYIAKEYQCMDLSTIIRRFKDTFRILVGKSKAYHYWEDENV